MNEPVTLSFVGDILFGEPLESYKNGVRTFVSKHGVDPFEFCRPMFQGSSHVVGNLECVVTDISNKTGLLREILRAPKSFAEVLQRGGITIVNLANNHTLDHGAEALRDTIENLRRCGIQSFGYREDGSVQEQPLVVSEHCVDLGFLGYNLANMDDARLNEAVEKALTAAPKAKEKVDVLIVSLHWGREYTNMTAPSLVRMGKRFLDTGCDVLYGHHSHRQQGVLMLNRKLVAPSLGNFVFDDIRSANRLNSILRLKVDSRGVVDYDVIPCYLNDRYQPVPTETCRGEIDRLTRELSEMMDCRAETGAQIEEDIARQVNREHLKNRIRIRYRLLRYWYNYIAHAHTLVHWKLIRRQRVFSVTDS